MRRPRASVVLVLAALVTASLALAASGGVGRKVLSGRGFPTSVTVSFTAPEGYTIKGSGYENWTGPLFSSLTTGSNDLESGVHFDVHPDFTTSSITKAARDKVGTEMGGQPTRQVAAGPIDVPHLIRGKRVGVVKGFFVMRQVTSEGYEGWYEGGLAFSPGKGYPILGAIVDTTAPADDSDKRIKDTLPSVWNRRVVEEGIGGIVVEGNLAPRKISARVRGRRISGRVTDSLGHAVIGAAVKLRKAGARPCCRAVTSSTGAYALTVPRGAGTGAFELSASAGAATLSKRVQLG
jgi:hypothetical protein